MSQETDYLLEFEKPLKDLEKQLHLLTQSSEGSSVDLAAEIQSIQKKIATTKETIYQDLTPWQKVLLARHPKRPYTIDYIHEIFDDFQELHGDRLYKDDPAMVGGLASFKGKPVMVIGIQKGRNTKENLKRNFGSPHPEGYRKAMRLMRLAEKFSLPIISLIDTPGAYPGIGAEEHHVAEAIAVNIREMSRLKTPIIATVIGEGGSGGALGIGVADRVLILENAYYSVISPEGCAAILWKDRANAPHAADALQLEAKKLLELGVVDEILPEPLGGAHCDITIAAKNLSNAIERNLEALRAQQPLEWIENRYQKFRKLGIFSENG